MMNSPALEKKEGKSPALDATSVIKNSPVESKKSWDSYKESEKESYPFEIKENVFASVTEENLQSVVRERYKRAHGNTVRIPATKNEVKTRLSLNDMQRKPSNESDGEMSIKSRLTLDNEEETKVMTPRGTGTVDRPTKMKKMEGFSGIM
jgi:hypothetical protein